MPLLYQFGMHIAIGSVGIRSSCSDTADRSGSDNRDPCCSCFATLEPVSLLAKRFAFSASSARLVKSFPKRNSFEVSFAFCWAAQISLFKASLNDSSAGKCPCVMQGGGVWRRAAVHTLRRSIIFRLTSDIIRLDTVFNVHPTCSCSKTKW